MRLIKALLLTALALTAVSCAREQSVQHSREVATNTAAPAPQTAESVSRPNNAAQQAGFQKVSLQQADQSQTATAAVERKIIRNAEVTIEVAAPAEAQRKVASVAEAHGGFVVTSEAQQNDSGGQPSEVVQITMRVPAAQFDAALAEIRGVGSRVRQEKITGQDVTEEFIDLDARLRTQRALEAQFLEIMKQAHSVSEALEVNRQLAEVRGGIEQLEGRRRFLENQAALSTIKVTLQTPAPLVSANTSGFFHGLREAFGDGVDVAVGIVLVLVRIVIALIPVVLLIVLPLVLLWRFLRRRYRRTHPIAPPVAATPAKSQ